MKTWLVPGSFALGLPALLLAAGCDSGSGLGPGASSFEGNVSSAMTAAAPESPLRRFASWLFPVAPRLAYAQGANDSVEGIIVAIQGNGEATGITDSNGDFRIGRAPTGDVFVVFRRGACEAGFPLDAVPSRAAITLSNVTFDCDQASPGAIGESFEAVLRDRPASPDDLDTCVRAGRDQRRRNVSAEDADIEFSNGSSATFGDLDDDDRLEIEGSRTQIGSAGALAASRIRILERGVNDPCDDDPFE